MIVWKIVAEEFVAHALMDNHFNPSPLSSKLALKGCVRYIFASLFFKFKGKYL